MAALSLLGENPHRPPGTQLLRSGFLCFCFCSLNVYYILGEFPWWWACLVFTAHAHTHASLAPGSPSFQHRDTGANVHHAQIYLPVDLSRLKTQIERRVHSKSTPGHCGDLSSCGSDLSPPKFCHYLSPLDPALQNCLHICPPPPNICNSGPSGRFCPPPDSLPLPRSTPLDQPLPLDLLLSLSPTSPPGSAPPPKICPSPSDLPLPWICPSPESAPPLDLPPPSDLPLPRSAPPRYTPPVLSHPPPICPSPSDLPLPWISPSPRISPSPVGVALVTTLLSRCDPLERSLTTQKHKSAVALQATLDASCRCVFDHCIFGAAFLYKSVHRRCIPAQADGKQVGTSGCQKVNG